MNKVYFPNLNGLRFIAAFLVLVHHNERIRLRFAWTNHWDNPFIIIIGKLGVILFFVLSGFLITYILLREEKESGTISVKDFYLRRILRIWPLYYLVVLAGLFVLPYLSPLSYGNDFSMLFANYGSNITLFIFFLPNLAYVLNSSIPFISQAWSVGVEEQFYLQWPLLMKSVKRKLPLLLGIIFSYNILRFALFAFSKNRPEATGLKALWHFIELFNIDCMAIGGLAALFYYRNTTAILNLVYHRATQIITVLLLFLLIGFGIRIPYFHYQFYSILFAILILNLATNKKSVFSLENPALNYLGKISYGIYMYHPLTLYVVCRFLFERNLSNPFIELFAGTVFTVLISAISYEFFEKFFLKKKLRFSKFISGDNAVEATEEKS
ncbi:MAG: acyltransferase [Bacteroidia bacterium]